MKTKHLIFISCLLAVSIYSRATHIVGGEIYYQCQGNNDYLVTLKLYRDCGPANTNGTPFDPSAAVSVYNSGSLINTYYFPFPGAAQLPIITNNPCLIPPNICVEEAIYSQVINLPPIAGGYDIIYQRCCRNPTIINIQIPSDKGSTWAAQVPDPADASCNSSPFFNQKPPLALCVGDNLVFDHSATDPDGDSLVYQLCIPYHGGSPGNPAPDPASAPPYPIIVWNSGYSASYPIDANPAFQIDPQTGVLTGTPTMAGQYVFGVCVQEYRNGVLISENKRDFQFNVVVCQPVVVAAIPAQTLFCDGHTVSFQNNSPGAISSYDWDFGDPNATNDTSNQISPTWTYADTGYYTVTLIANPGWPCADTAIATYAVFPTLSASFVSPAGQCLGGNSFNFSAGGSYDPVATFLWEFGPNASPDSSTLEDPVGISFNTPGTYPVTLSISENGCTETFTSNVVVFDGPIAGIQQQSTFCTGLTVNFTDDTQFASSWFWDFGDGNSSAAQHPTHTYQDTGTYVITLIASNSLGCSDTVQAIWQVYPSVTAVIPAVLGQCVEGNSFDFVAAGNFDSNATFSWYFGSTASPSTSTSQNPTGVVFNAYGLPVVTLIINQNGCADTTHRQVTVYPKPELDYVLKGAIGCAPHTVRFYDRSFAWTTIYYEWDFGDGFTSDEANPSHTYLYPGTYDVSLIIYTDEGCIDTLWLYRPDAVTVNPSPTAGFIVDPKWVSVFEPIVDILDQSIGAETFDFDLGDGQALHTANGTHDYDAAGIYTLIQTVTNEWGCTDTAMDQVKVIPNFIPNAFTPGEHSVGINDVFMPVSWTDVQVRNYRFMIFDRWGEMLFVTEDILEPWDGTAPLKGGSDLVPSDVYVYRVDVTTTIGKKHRFLGHVTVVR